MTHFGEAYQLRYLELKDRACACASRNFDALAEDTDRAALDEICSSVQGVYAEEQQPLGLITAKK